MCYKLPGILCNSLLCAVLRVAVSASSFQHVRELGPVLDARPGDGRTLALSKLLPYVPKEMSVKKGEIPLRYAFDLFLIFSKASSICSTCLSISSAWCIGVLIKLYMSTHAFCMLYQAY